MCAAAPRGVRGVAVHLRALQGRRRLPEGVLGEEDQGPGHVLSLRGGGGDRGTWLRAGAGPVTVRDLPPAPRRNL